MTVPWSFLNSLTRILTADYLPTTGLSQFDYKGDYSLMLPLEDILNARMQTLGVVEHSLPLHRGNADIMWRMYDVGGAVRF
jgi:hypothetical protein